MLKTNMKPMMLLAALLSAAFLHGEAQNIKTVNNLAAAEQMVYFDIDKGQIVAAADAGWDIAFHKTSISVNSEKGNVSAQVVAGTSFDKLAKAPATGYIKDGKQTAVPGGSGNGWYVYNMDDHTIQPIADRVIVIKTTAGKTAKLAILSYYKDQADYNPGGYYSFQYAFFE
ncbi:MAG TPA: HmuY family protein [Chitinophagaceae bacterium]|nr:HmuY family protein [Chitinophagaceae bacterium]